MTKLILAVSGGIDSMVMLDMIYRSGEYSSGNIIVAHFDHGTRPSSKNDTFFVKETIANKYNLTTFIAEGNLGEDVSESVARKHRYDYLFYLAHNFMPGPQTIYLSATEPGKPKVGLEHPIPKICTAHHLDDLVESIAINLIRGTGWRGLVVLDTPNIVRPFITPEIISMDTPWDKKAILKYAAEHNIVFRQDPTNYEDKYLRNRIRESLAEFPDQKKRELYALWRRQRDLKREIDRLIAEIIPLSGSPWQRSWFNNLDESVALELLRAGTLEAGISATRPQLRDFLQAIRTYAPGKYFNLPNRLIRLEKNYFVL